MLVGAGALDSPLEGVIKSSCRKHYVDNTNEIVDEMSEGSGRRIYAKQKLRRSPTENKLQQH